MRVCVYVHVICISYVYVGACVCVNVDICNVCTGVCMGMSILIYYVLKMLISGIGQVVTAIMKFILLNDVP